VEVLAVAYVNRLYANKLLIYMLTCMIKLFYGAIYFWLSEADWDTSNSDLWEVLLVYMNSLAFKASTLIFGFALHRLK
jgi:hypothetical protein